MICIKQKISLLMALALVFLLVACGGSDSSAPLVTSTVPPTSTSTAPAPDSSEPEVVLNQAFLTGLEKGSDYPEGKRITGVMVNNIASSRPTRGLSECQMLVEIKVEGGITRFMAVYEDYEKIPEIGSIRSARDQFFQLLLPFWGFYVHDGQSTPMNHFFSDWEYDEFDIAAGKRSGLTWRDQARRDAGFAYEYTEYTDGAHIAQAIEDYNLDDYRSYGSPMFNFVSYLEDARVPAEGEADEVAVIHSTSYITYFAFENGKYKMSQWNSSRGAVQETIDENNDEQVQFDNLIVIFAPMTLYADSPLVKVDYIGGAGYYFSQGGYETILWEKGGPNEALQMYKIDKSGEAVEINPGTTYLAVVDDKQLPDFDEALKSGTAGDVVAGGEVNTNEVETED